MSAIDAGYQLLESALNQYLQQDPEISSRLARLHGRVIAIELLGTGLCFYLVPTQSASLQVLSRYEGQPDCHISGPPFSLLGSALKNDPANTFSGAIRVTGNTSLAQEITDILKSIEIDWEEHLATLTGDLLGHQLGRRLHLSAGWISRLADTTGINLGEYLQQEIRLLPSVIELENFYHDVDVLRDDSERLAVRIARLQQRRKENS